MVCFQAQRHAASYFVRVCADEGLERSGAIFRLGKVQGDGGVWVVRTFLSFWTRWVGPGKETSSIFGRYRGR